VGGIIVETKRIRTRNGDPMMFATLDDLGGTVEMLVFGKALAEHEAALAVDEVVLVTGRVDHKEATKTCLIVQAVERFSPSQEEIESARESTKDGPSAAGALAAPVHLRVDATRLTDSAIEDLKQAIEDFPGSAEVVLDLDTSAGTRRLKLGEAYRVQHTPALRAELEHALAPAPGTSVHGARAAEARFSVEPGPEAPAARGPVSQAPAPAAPAPTAPAPAAPAPAASLAGG